MESTQADPFNMFRSPFPSRHLNAAQDLRIQEQIRFPEREYVSYVISGSRTEIEYEDVVIDTTDFIQGSMISSLIFTAKMGTAENSVITWFAFHHKDYDNHAVNFLRWVLSGYGYAIELDIGSLLLRVEDPERTIQTVCSRAYARSICYKDYWRYIRDLSTFSILRAKISIKKMPTVPMVNLAMRNLENGGDSSC